MVYVNPDERVAIYDGAKAAGLSASAYLRALGTGHRPQGIRDVDATNRLVSINKDVGKLARLVGGRLGLEPRTLIEAVQARLAEAARQIGSR